MRQHALLASTSPFQLFVMTAPLDVIAARLKAHAITVAINTTSPITARANLALLTAKYVPMVQIA